jgi:hypothetical protein
VHQPSSGPSPPLLHRAKRAGTGSSGPSTTGQTPRPLPLTATAGVSLKSARAGRNLGASAELEWMTEPGRSTSRCSRCGARFPSLGSLECPACHRGHVQAASAAPKPKHPAPAAEPKHPAPLPVESERRGGQARAARLSKARRAEIAGLLTGRTHDSESRSQDPLCFLKDATWRRFLEELEMFTDVPATARKADTSCALGSGQITCSLHRAALSLTVSPARLRVASTSTAA